MEEEKEIVPSSEVDPDPQAPGLEPREEEEAEVDTEADVPPAEDEEL